MAVNYELNAHSQARTLFSDDWIVCLWILIGCDMWVFFLSWKDFDISSTSTNLNWPRKNILKTFFSFQLQIIWKYTSCLCIKDHSGKPGYKVQCAKNNYREWKKCKKYERTCSINQKTWRRVKASLTINTTWWNAKTPHRINVVSSWYKIPCFFSQSGFQVAIDYDVIPWLLGYQWLPL